MHALKTDHHLVVKGSGGTIFALGDAATIQQDKALDHAAELFRHGLEAKQRAPRLLHFLLLISAMLTLRLV